MTHEEMMSKIEAWEAKPLEERGELMFYAGSSLGHYVQYRYYACGITSVWSCVFGDTTEVASGVWRWTGRELQYWRKDVHLENWYKVESAAEAMYLAWVASKVVG